MQHNIPLIRRVYQHATKNPESFNQSKWSKCVAGLTIELHGGYAFKREPGSLRDATEVVNFATRDTEDIETVAARLLGLWPEEAAGLFAASNSDALDWLNDILVTHDAKAYGAHFGGYASRIYERLEDLEDKSAWSDKGSDAGEKALQDYLQALHTTAQLRTAEAADTARYQESKGVEAEKRHARNLAAA
ncbi:hypothetical protein ACFRAQ_36070 [Nocardia sp. NPDC056611]|uniref:hypothetical protein n=1 Tax=Nocardia sp. NPDC056611 TaxID=3345877 RepID=UPI003673249C